MTEVLPRLPPAIQVGEPTVATPEQMRAHSRFEEGGGAPEPAETAGAPPRAEGLAEGAPPSPARQAASPARRALSPVRRVAPRPRSPTKPARGSPRRKKAATPEEEAPEPPPQRRAPPAGAPPSPRRSPQSPRATPGSGAGSLVALPEVGDPFDPATQAPEAPEFGPFFGGLELLLRQAIWTMLRTPELRREYEAARDKKAFLVGRTSPGSAVPLEVLLLRWYQHFAPGKADPAALGNLAQTYRGREAELFGRLYHTYVDPRWDIFAPIE